MICVLFKIHPMQTFLIVTGSLLTSSLLWIIPLLMMDRNKPEEEIEDQQPVPETINDVPEEVYTDENIEEMDVTSFFAYNIVDELITVALAKKIVSREVSAEYAFSVN